MALDPSCRRPAPTRRVGLAALVLAAAVAGCEQEAGRFEPDRLLRATHGLTDGQSASIDAALEKLFGTPGEPRLPADLPRLADRLSVDALRQAAGPVVSHEVGVTQGLYWRHCASCHGVTGDGRGPTALYLAPYPRDFRRGVFKWKSTYRDAAPTRADLDRVIEHGVPGTAMPSFALLSEAERDILRQYVEYLAIRGQAERELVAFVADELPAGEALTFEGELRDELTAEWLAPIVDRWDEARSRVVAVEGTEATEPAGEGESAGRVLYHSERAGCYKCHGPEGQGGAVAGKDYEIDYDLWSRGRVVVQPTEDVQQLLARDLPPRPAKPLALTGATPHGGATFDDLYRRLHQGVAGTPMPAVGGTAPDQAGALADQEVAQLAAYVRSLLGDPSQDGDPSQETGGPSI